MYAIYLKNSNRMVALKDCVMVETEQEAKWYCVLNPDYTFKEVVKTAYEEVLGLKGKVPEVVYRDITKRCGDWLEDEMNGEDDRYIEKQLEFGRKFVKK